MFNVLRARLFTCIAARLQTLDGATDAPNPLFDMLLFGKAKAQPEILLTSAIHVKWLANHQSYPLARHFTQERARAQISRQATPEVETTHRPVHTHLTRPVGSYCLEHQVAFTMV